MFDIAGSVSSELGDWPKDAAPALLFPLIGHLERMIATGRVAMRREPQDAVALYTWVK